MKRKIYLPLLAGLAIAAAGCEEEVLAGVGPTEVAAQEAPADAMHRRGPGMRAGRVNPAARILAQREALALTADQVARLETLSAELKTRNEALRAQIEAQRPERPALSEEQREAMRERRRSGDRPRRPQLTEEQRAELQTRREALRPLMQQLAQSQRQTMDQVREILTDEQEAKLRGRRS